MHWKRSTRWMAILLPVLFVAPTVAVTTSAQESENLYTSRLDLRMGRSVFRAQCTTCHGLNAGGGNEGVGPDLTTGRFRRADSDLGLYRIIRDGVPGTSMTGVGTDASEQSVWQLVTYLRSLNDFSSAADLPGSAEAGQRIFVGKGDCAQCHMVNGQGGRLGPNLSLLGEQRDPETIQAALLDPNADVDPRWWTMRATGPNGQSFEGVRMNEDTFTFRIMDAEENLRAFSKYGDWSYERVQTSTMPSYADNLTVDEREDLVAYLYSLRSKP
ncbi:MAG TPA: hypothetical protein DIU48_13985 [Acidobacteria bacterium]|nr:hypothetical protein [Acidobacteriota bacterium]